MKELGKPMVVHVLSSETGERRRTLDANQFQREHSKLQKTLKQKSMRPSRIASHAPSKVGQSHARSGGGSGASDGRIGHNHHISRDEVEAELKQLLRDTNSLTDRLRGQLMELHRRGWNAPMASAAVAALSKAT